MAHIQMMDAATAANATVSLNDLENDTTGRTQGKLLSVMENQGFVIVTDVLCADEIAELEQMWADDLRGIVDLPEAAKRALPMLQDPLHRWKVDEFPLSSKSNAFATDFGLPHGRMPWAVRTHPRVKAVFEKLFGTDELCVGMDNVFFSPNRPSIANDADRVERLWPHADQSSHLEPAGKWSCYQGVVYLWPATIDTSATVVWPGSNVSFYPRLMAQRSFRGHFCMLSTSDFPQFVEHARRVPVPAGGMLLWSSKTVHQGYAQGQRLAVPCCMEPVKRRSAKALESKIQCCITGTPTSHWASLGIPHTIAGAGAKGGDAGTKEVPLRHSAHEHLLSPDGKSIANPAVLALL